MTTPRAFPCIALGEVADFYGGASLPMGVPFAGQSDGYLLARVSDMNLPENDLYLRSTKSWSSTAGSRSATAPKGSLLIPKRGGAIGTNKKRMILRPCILDPNLMAILPHPDRLDLRFLYHWFLTFDLLSITSGSSVPQLNKQDLGPLKIPLPTIETQQHVSHMLDLADALRAKRRRAIALLSGLAQSIFLDIFGDPEPNPKGWPRSRFGSLLAEPLRNGLSPSKGGPVEAKVLTLSAITGSGFDSSAFKIGTFNAAPPIRQSVNQVDFLICRGNGNKELVGKGYYPTDNYSDITFPDTMIAACVRADLIDRGFLEHTWNMSTTRRQIESYARTTNGTFKVNQTALENICLIQPPLESQQEFGRLIDEIKAVRKSHEVHLGALEALFASMQHRAFRGEL